ncbi:HAD family hydrolase [Aerococcus sanguinicola]|uniref:Cof-type HAD-IIB family hydrolase n=1 Tax=Aerococcus sanguinicola TaxID=119206 RepID=A0A2I1MQC2_9LACT|nr:MULTISPECIES: HAD family hydrolase [Aerococcus]MDK7050058.1 HAD family hydrolase [Aerococcus sanguinicola]OFT93375.1 hydrolase [Aerococcus sp. HMSC23C02]PKZ22340.1 Cof-type HAD-IIB family hydrolase [Aerococcus sanguinicola]
MPTPYIQLILTDIDGTILTDQQALDPGLKEAVQALKPRQIPFILASARSPHGMFPLMEALDLDRSPLACYNGALILSGDAKDYEIIAEHGLDRDDLGLILDQVQEHFPQVAIGWYSGTDWLVNAHNQWTDIEHQITGDHPIVKDLQEVFTQGDRVAHKLLLIDEAEVIAEVQAFLETLPLKHSACYLSKANYLEITHQSVSKEHALKEVAAFYQVPLANCLTLGDNFNDVPMLQAAGLGVAMANAPQAVQDQADVVTASNNDRGVSRALQRYVLKD